MINLMGSSQSKVTFSSKPPTVYMMVDFKVQVKQLPLESFLIFEKAGEKPFSSL